MSAGRKTKLTPETVKAVTDAIREGSTQDDAARLAGIARTTFYEWMNAKPEFADAVQKAHADFKRAQVKAIRAAGIRAKKDAHGEVIGTEGSWQANAWLLERKYPEDFGQRMTYKLDPDQLAILARHGLTPKEAMAQLINALGEDDDASAD